MSDYFRRRYKRFDGDISVKVDLSNYSTKNDLKYVSHVDVSSFALKSNLASLKTEVDKIDADKLKTVPVDLSKLSNVVEKDGTYEKDGSDFEDKIDKRDKKIPDVTDLVKEKKQGRHFGKWDDQKVELDFIVYGVVIKFIPT